MSKVSALTADCISAQLCCGIQHQLELPRGEVSRPNKTCRLIATRAKITEALALAVLGTLGAYLYRGLFRYYFSKELTTTSGSLLKGQQCWSANVNAAYAANAASVLEAPIHHPSIYHTDAKHSQNSLRGTRPIKKNCKVITLRMINNVFWQGANTG